VQEPGNPTSKAAEVDRTSGMAFQQCPTRNILS
jgi:hypothetical protein